MQDAHLVVYLYIKGGHGLTMVLQSIEDIISIRTVQEVNRQTFAERALLNYGCEHRRGQPKSKKYKID